MANSAVLLAQCPPGYVFSKESVGFVQSVLSSNDAASVLELEARDAQTFVDMLEAVSYPQSQPRHFCIQQNQRRWHPLFFMTTSVLPTLVLCKGSVVRLV
jgi:hypothetical protein